MARPRGLPAAPAPLLDRRAHEPVHVAVDRRARRRRPAASSTSCCSTTAAREVLADEVGREALHCIRCSACLNVCPVYARVGGHAYELGLSGADRRDPDAAAARDPRRRRRCPAPRALCGACSDVCPVKIDIPRVLVHLRGRAWRERRIRPSGWPCALRQGVRRRRRYEAAQRAGWPGRCARADAAAAAGWTKGRDLPPPPRETFRDGGGARAVSGRPARHQCGARGRARTHPRGRPAATRRAVRCRATTRRARRARAGARGPLRRARGRVPRLGVPGGRAEIARRVGRCSARERGAPHGGRRPACRRVAAGRASSWWRRPDPVGPARSTASTACSPAARWPWPRPARSCSTRAGSGRRALTLVPDWHVVHRAGRPGGGSVPEAVAALGRGRRGGPAADPGLGPVGDVGHRAAPGRGRARPAAARRAAGRGLSGERGAAGAEAADDRAHRRHRLHARADLRQRLSGRLAHGAVRRPGHGAGRGREMGLGGRPTTGRSPGAAPAARAASSPASPPSSAARSTRCRS